MKDYFIRLFNYDEYANQALLKAMRAAADPEKPVQLMAHLLRAQQIWLGRCKGEPATNTALWPNGRLIHLTGSQAKIAGHGWLI